MNPAHGDSPATAVPAVELRGVWKRFPGVVANAGAHLTVRAGTVHAVLGENGAGKSTLMNVLAGVYRPDEGELRIELGAARALLFLGRRSLLLLGRRRLLGRGRLLGGLRFLFLGG